MTRPIPSSTHRQNVAPQENNQENLPERPIWSQVVNPSGPSSTNASSRSNGNRQDNARSHQVERTGNPREKTWLEYNAESLGNSFAGMFNQVIHRQSQRPASTTVQQPPQSGNEARRNAQGKERSGRQEVFIAPSSNNASTEQVIGLDPARTMYPQDLRLFNMLPRPSSSEYDSMSPEEQYAKLQGDIRGYLDIGDWRKAEPSERPSSDIASSRSDLVGPLPPLREPPPVSHGGGMVLDEKIKEEDTPPASPKLPSDTTHQPSHVLNSLERMLKPDTAGQSLMSMRSDSQDSLDSPALSIIPEVSEPPSSVESPSKESSHPFEAAASNHMGKLLPEARYADHGNEDLVQQPMGAIPSSAEQFAAQQTSHVAPDREQTGNLPPTQEKPKPRVLNLFEQLSLVHGMGPSHMPTGETASTRSHIAQTGSIDKENQPSSSRLQKIRSFLSSPRRTEPLNRPPLPNSNAGLQPPSLAAPIEPRTNDPVNQQPQQSGIRQTSFDPAMTMSVSPNPSAYSNSMQEAVLQNASMVGTLPQSPGLSPSRPLSRSSESIFAPMDSMTSRELTNSPGLGSLVNLTARNSLDSPSSAATNPSLPSIYTGPPLNFQPQSSWQAPDVPLDDRLKNIGEMTSDFRESTLLNREDFPPGYFLQWAEAMRRQGAQARTTRSFGEVMGYHDAHNFFLNLHHSQVQSSVQLAEQSRQAPGSVSGNDSNPKAPALSGWTVHQAPRAFEMAQAFYESNNGSALQASPTHLGPVSFPQAGMPPFAMPGQGAPIQLPVNPVVAPGVPPLDVLSMAQPTQIQNLGQGNPIQGDPSRAGTLMTAHFQGTPAAPIAPASPTLPSSPGWPDSPPDRL